VTTHTAATTALLDQLDAATSDARRLWATHIVQRLDDPSPVPPNAPGIRRVHAAFLAAVGGLVTGTTRRCQHVDLSAPRPYSWMAWHPRVVHCARPECAVVLGVDDDLNGTPEDHTCDGCRRYAPSTVTVVTYTSGVFLIGAGLCRRCRTAPGAAR